MNSILYRLYLWRIKSPRREPLNVREMMIDDNFNIIRGDTKRLKYLSRRIYLAFNHKNIV